MKKVLEAGRIVVNSKRFADQFAIGSQHGHVRKLGSHINTDDKVMKKLRQIGTSFQNEQIESEHPPHPECQTALHVIRVAQNL